MRGFAVISSVQCKHAVLGCGRCWLFEVLLCVAQRWSCVQVELTPFSDVDSGLCLPLVSITAL